MTTPHPAESPERGPQTFKDKAQGSWNWLIGYDSMEANRLGVPIVSSKDWVKDLVANPGSKVSRVELDGKSWVEHKADPPSRHLEQMSAKEIFHCIQSYFKCLSHSDRKVWSRGIDGSKTSSSWPRLRKILIPYIRNSTLPTFALSRSTTTSMGCSHSPNGSDLTIFNGSSEI